MPRPGMSRSSVLTKLRKAVAADRPPCHLCGNEIAWEANWRDDLAPQIDHLVPRSHGGPDVIDNVRASHRACNRQRGNKPLLPGGVIFITHRDWT